MYKRTECLKLINDIKKKRDNWNERSNFTLKGVKNLSLSDLDTLIVYVDVYYDYGYFNGLMKPLGSIKEVLNKYGIN